MLDKFSVNGSITNEGKVIVHGIDQLKAFNKKNAGKQIIYTIEILPPDVTERMIKYYYGYIVKRFVEFFYKSAMYYTEEKMDEYLRDHVTVCRKESYVDGEWCHEIVKFEELNRWNAMVMIEQLRCLALEFGFEIDQTIGI